jgi:hypothetical protein
MISTHEFDASFDAYDRAEAARGKDDAPDNN